MWDKFLVAISTSLVAVQLVHMVEATMLLKVDLVVVPLDSMTMVLVLLVILLLQTLAVAVVVLLVQPITLHKVELAALV